MRKSKICLSCLRKIDVSEKGCPFCGFDPDVITDKKLLPAGILLYYRYYVGKVLGEGGFGITYTGYDISEKRPVAIKEYFPANIAQRNICQDNKYAVIPFDGDNGNLYEHGLECFAQEAKVLNRLTKLSHVVKVYDYLLQNNTGYLIMEYVPGSTLRECVKKKGTFSIRQMYDVIGPIIDDLARIHQMGIVHRDLSPDNIILQANGIAKVIDFGTARTVFQKEDGSNKTMTVMLRQQYAPKEQYLPNGPVGAWSDVYSLCATMYFMLSGKNPENVFEREAKDIEKEFSVEKDFSNAQKFIHVLEKGMNVDYKKRYQSMEELQKELKAAIIREKEGEQLPEHTIYIDREQKKAKYMPLSEKRRKWKCRAAFVLGLCLIVMAGAAGYSHFFKKNISMNKNSRQIVRQKLLPAQTHRNASDASVNDTKEIADRSPSVSLDNSSDSREMVIVPDVCTKTYQEAKKILHSADTDLLIIVKMKYDTTVKKGRVIKQSIRAGKSYRKKAEKEIVLTVSKGKHSEKKARIVITKSPDTPAAKRARTKQPERIDLPQRTKAPKKNIKIITQD